MQLAFDSPAWALVKTYVMMIGEFEFQGMFTDHDDPDKDVNDAKNIPFPEYSTLLFVVFVLFMSVIIMNLMVGLAVDDIKEIQEHAELYQISMHVRLVLESERFLSYCMWSSFLTEYSTTKEILRNEKPGILAFVLSKANIWASLEQRGKARGREGDMDIIKQNQRDLGTVVRRLTAQMDGLMEESGELKDMMMKIQGNKKLINSSL